MRCVNYICDVKKAVFVYEVTIVTWLLGGVLDVSLAEDYSVETRTWTTQPGTLMSQHPPEHEACCSGILGYASDNLSLNYPCENLSCCNISHTVTVRAVDFAMGFQFQCMPRTNVQPLCYETGAEVRTTNQDPDFIPRACCQGLKFKVLVNQWYAAMVVKCVEQKSEGSLS